MREAARGDDGAPGPGRDTGTPDNGTSDKGARETGGREPSRDGLGETPRETTPPLPERRAPGRPDHGAGGDAGVPGRPRSLLLATRDGSVHCRLYLPDAGPGEAPSAGVVWIGEAAADRREPSWTGPARDLFPRQAMDLTGEGIASLWVRLRRPSEPSACLHDAMAGARYLETRGVRRLALVGHGAGAACALAAAARLASARAVVLLAPTPPSASGRAAAALRRLGPRCALLLIHGRDDGQAPADTAEAWHRLAQPPKRLLLFNGAGHALDEVADRVHREVRDHLLGQLRA